MNITSKMDQAWSTVWESLQSAMALNYYGYIVGFAIGLPTTYFGYRFYRGEKMRQKIKTRALRSKKDIEELKRELKKHAQDIDPSLVELSFQELQAKLQSGEVTATRALRSYQAKALAVNDDINAITDVIKDAAEIARRLDALDSSQRGPFHGVPISLKESCGIKGLDCTAGFTEMADIPKEEDSVLVQVLKSLGAVPFIRTNIPQGMASLTCSNPLFGNTLNPLDIKRGPGGSSGGEAAIIGGRGSILGVGSDLGGSIRIPACWCGIAGYKPTAGRISGVGNWGTRETALQNTILTTDGPMARDVFAIVQFMEKVFSHEHFKLDPYIPPMTFRREIFESKRPLKIGYYVHDGCTRCVPAVERAVMMSKAALQRLGHYVVEVEPYKPLSAFTDLLLAALLADNGKGVEHLLKWDNSDERLMPLFKFQSKPHYYRWMFSKLTEMLTNEPVIVSAMKRPETRTLSEWFRLSWDVNHFREVYSKRWRDLGLDALLCPCMPCAAPFEDVDMTILGTGTYTAVFNVVNYPAGTVPVTTVTKTDIAKTMDPKFYNAQTNLEKMIRRSSEGTEGLPVGVQVVSTPYMDENVLRVMMELENTLKI